MSEAMRIAPTTIVLCTVESGVDTVLEFIRRGGVCSALLGLSPLATCIPNVSGYVDVAPFAAQFGLRHVYVNSYDLSDERDVAAITNLHPQMVIVAGWQRLVPSWLVRLPVYGVLGGHGSPDGITAGRGRSPQNWAIMLECTRFELSLFRICDGVDDGPVLATREFLYTESDDIRCSYYKAALAMADMLIEVQGDPKRCLNGVAQLGNPTYYPQRTAEDGRVDWRLPISKITALCRALAKPYPGMRTRHINTEITVWECQYFDSRVEEGVGTIGPCFVSGEFLINCADGRLLVRDWEVPDGFEWAPSPGMQLQVEDIRETLQKVISRHEEKHPRMKITTRIYDLLLNYSLELSKKHDS